jgi:acetolactate synthase-1/2/3 large subunit
MAKWASQIDDADRAGEMIDRAFATAMQGRMGPVVLAMPEDVLRAETTAAAPPPSPAARSGLDVVALVAIAERLMAAERPMILLGGSGWCAEPLKMFTAWLEAHGLPVALSFRRKDLIDNRNPCFIGDLGLGPNPKLVERFKAADLVLAIGARLGENPSQGYTLFTREETAERLIHIHPGPEELGRVWPAAIMATADVSLAAQSLAALELGRSWAETTAQARAEYQAFTRPIAVDAKVNLSEVVAHMTEALPADAIMCNGAGNFSAWLHRFDRRRAFPSQLAPTSGAMGYGVPAAIAAKIVEPYREVVCFCGDGDFLMTGQELATAAQQGANVVFIVVDNGSYGTIRMHQERDYPGRTVATDLANPDFAAYARSFGCWAETVEKTADFASAFAAARKAGKPALIHLKTDVEHISPGRTLTQLRAGRA